MSWLHVPTSIPRTQGQYDPGSRHLCPGSESRDAVIQGNSFFSQDSHAFTASSLATLVSEISQGQEGFSVGILSWQPEAALIFLRS